MSFYDYRRFKLNVPPLYVPPQSVPTMLPFTIEDPETVPSPQKMPRQGLNSLTVNLKSFPMIDPVSEPLPFPVITAVPETELPLCTNVVETAN